MIPYVLVANTNEGCDNCEEFFDDVVWAFCKEENESLEIIADIVKKYIIKEGVVDLYNPCEDFRVLSYAYGKEELYVRMIFDNSGNLVRINKNDKAVLP